MPGPKKLFSLLLVVLLLCFGASLAHAQCGSDYCPTPSYSGSYGYSHSYSQPRSYVRTVARTYYAVSCRPDETEPWTFHGSWYSRSVAEDRAYQLECDGLQVRLQIVNPRGY